MKTSGDKWFQEKTVSVSIGQGAVWLHPVGTMQLASFVANEGVDLQTPDCKPVVSP